MTSHKKGRFGSDSTTKVECVFFLQHSNNRNTRVLHVLLLEDQGFKNGFFRSFIQRSFRSGSSQSIKYHFLC